VRVSRQPAPHPPPHALETSERPPRHDVVASSRFARRVLGERLLADCPRMHGHYTRTHDPEQRIRNRREKAQAGTSAARWEPGRRAGQRTGRLLLTASSHTPAGVIRPSVEDRATTTGRPRLPPGRERVCRKREKSTPTCLLPRSPGGWPRRRARRSSTVAVRSRR
jgi:hypothetical protein